VFKRPDLILGEVDGAVIEASCTTFIQLPVTPSVIFHLIILFIEHRPEENFAWPRRLHPILESFFEPQALELLGRKYILPEPSEKRPELIESRDDSQSLVQELL
jgi:hypothetical protein